jgi:hypothetical protein
MSVITGAYDHQLLLRSSSATVCHNLQRLVDFVVGDLDDPKSALHKNALVTCFGLELEQHRTANDTGDDIVYPFNRVSDQRISSSKVVNHIADHNKRHSSG